MPKPLDTRGSDGGAIGTAFVTETLARGIAAHQQRRPLDAEACYRSVLKREPEHFEALLFLGISLCGRKEFSGAITVLKQAARLHPGSVDAHANLALAFKENGQLQLGLRSIKRALEIKADFAGAHNECGILLAGLGQLEQALGSYERALELRPGYTEALYNKANALAKLQRYEEALHCYDQVLMLQPTLVDALHNRGNVLRTLQKYELAAASYEMALRGSPAHQPPLNSLLGLAKMLELLYRLEPALALYREATGLYPSSTEAWNGLASALHRMGRYEEAAECFDRVVKLNPRYPGSYSMAVLSRLYCCEWSNHKAELSRVYEGAGEDGNWLPPWFQLATSDDAAEHLAMTRRWAAHCIPAAPDALWRGDPYKHERIRIAYLSADYHGHATAYLMAGVFEHHDRQRFEIIAISYGPRFQDEMRTRLTAAFDRFIDVSEMADIEIAKLVRDLEVDVAVDLKGYTADCRSGILAHRPAPIQVNYLGYPGTMAVDYIDYVIADRTVIPPEDARHYSEKVVYVPDCYQANDDKRPVADASLTRAEAGLPEDAFVFCCFNNSFKIRPEIFGIWMRILQSTKGSVLWLLEENASVVRNLRQEATRLGVSPQRLVFAPRVPAAEHLARHRLADLFLDTLPYNAHTTASDALWAGLPIITCIGKTFAGRVCASLLRAASLEELVTESLEDYERLACSLAADGKLLGKYRQILRSQRHSLPLFDTGRFTRGLEAAYSEMLKDLEVAQAGPAASLHSAIEPVAPL